MKNVKDNFCSLKFVNTIFVGNIFFDKRNGHFTIG